MPSKKIRKRRRAPRTRNIVPAPNPEVVGSVDGAALPVDALAGGQVRMVLEMVVLRRGLDSVVATTAGAEWVVAVHANLTDVGISTLRELLMATPILNRILGQTRHRQLHEATIIQMVEEMARMITWPGEEDESESDEG